MAALPRGDNSRMHCIVSKPNEYDWNPGRAGVDRLPQCGVIVGGTALLCTFALEKAGRETRGQLHFTQKLQNPLNAVTIERE
jgi:hypothetical protein